MAISDNDRSRTDGSTTPPGEDERIRKEVCDRMEKNGHLNARGISVRVESGEVWLRGEVDSERQRLLAVNIADSVSGVRDVHNRLSILGLEGRKKWAEAGAEGKEQQQGIDWRPQLHPGMPVIGTEGDKIGRVKEVWENDFLVARRLARDIYVSMFNIDNIKNATVMLNIPAHKIGEIGWEKLEQDQGQNEESGPGKSTDRIQKQS